jgi:hypothetical protein
LAIPATPTITQADAAKTAKVLLISTFRSPFEGKSKVDNPPSAS